MTRFDDFKNLHFKGTPLLLGNVWNVQNAIQYEKLGFKAIGTSSAAVANNFGYEDGENMPFDDYFFMVNRIAKSTNLPLSVDIEAGHGSTIDAIVSNIQMLNTIGVVGINIEDSTVSQSKRVIVDATIFKAKLNKITDELKSKNIRMFINVRCDTFLLSLPNALEEAKFRIKLYETANADGIFLPCITDENDIKAIIESTKLPLNVMCMPDLPNFETLKKLGVNRISMGNFMDAYLNRQMEKATKQIIEMNSFSPIF